MDNSTLKSRVEARFGANIKQSAIFILNPVVKSPQHLRRLLRGYLDERRKQAATRPEHIALDPNDPAYMEAIMRKEAPLRPGIDYISIGGGLHYFGSVKRAVCAAGEPDRLDEEAEIEAIVSWWCQQTKDHVKQAYHMEFSLNPRISLELGQRGIPVDPIIMGMAAKTLFEYNSRYYPDGVIGFVMGVHHDKLSPHVHTLLFPKLSSGRGLNVRNDQKTIVDGKEATIHYHDMLQGSFYRQADKLRRELDLDAPRVNSKECLKQEVLVALAAKRIAEQRTPGSLNVQTIAEEREILLDDRQLGARLMSLQESEAQTFDGRPPSEVELTAIAASFKRLAEEARKSAEASALDEAAVADRFAKHHAGQAYHPVYYVPGHPESPSGTRSFLSKTRVSSAKDVFKMPPTEGLDLLQTTQRAAALISAEDASNVLMREANEILKESEKRTTAAINDRFLRAMLNALPALSVAARTRGEEPLYLKPSDFNELRVHSDKSLREMVAQQIKDQIQREAFDHRPYTREEFEDQPRGAWLSNNTPHNPTVPVVVPSGTAIPDSPNFLARDLSSKTNEVVRDIAKLDEEDRLVRSDFDRLLRTRSIPDMDFDF